jgi:BirA family biotin operon repressor/biotin-[acetyl-CoA-carboxylase] ligase
MDEAWQRIAEGGLSAWDSILAARQSGGRGRLRRPWTSPAGNLHVSLALPEPPQPFRNMTSLLVGWCLACALGRQGVCLKLKWPNDLLINDRKVGGALVEERKGRLVTGVGLNLVACPPDEAMRADRAVPAAKLHIPGKGPLRVWLDALPIFREVWMKSQEGSPKDLARRVEGALAWLGGRVGVRDGERVRTGRLLGLDERGGLLLAEDGGTSALYSGSLFPL